MFEAFKSVHDLKPQLFVFDYQLPRMNGLELYDQLHATKELEEVPVLFMSADPLLEDLEKRGAPCLQKIFALEEFLERVEYLLA